MSHGQRYIFAAQRLLRALIIVSAFLLTAPTVLAYNGWVPDPNQDGSTTSRLSVVAGRCDPNPFLVAINIENGTLIPCECINNQGVCGLTQVFKTIVNVTQLILALTGSLALLMFIYGGTMFIIAAGSQERIQKAKQVLVTAAVGVAIIFSAWLIVNIVIGSLTNGDVHSPAAIFNNIWSNEPKIK